MTVVVLDSQEKKEIEITNEIEDKTSIWDFLATSLGISELLF